MKCTIGSFSTGNNDKTALGRPIPGRKETTMTKYEAKVVSLENGMTFTLEGRWESAKAMEEDLKKDGFVLIGYWVAFNQA